MAHESLQIVSGGSMTTAGSAAQDPRVVLMTPDHLAGEALVIACRNRGVAIEAVAPDGLRDPAPDILVLDARTPEPYRTQAAASVADGLGRVVVLADPPEVITVPAAARVSTSGGIDDLVAAVTGRRRHGEPPQDRKDRIGLTARETEVLRALVAGWGTAQMAERFRISRRTVGTHLRNIYAKLEVGSRTEAAAWAAAVGIAPVETDGDLPDGIA